MPWRPRRHRISISRRAAVKTILEVAAGQVSRAEERTTLVEAAILPKDRAARVRPQLGRLSILVSIHKLDFLEDARAGL